MSVLYVKGIDTENVRQRHPWAEAIVDQRNGYFLVFEFDTEFEEWVNSQGGRNENNRTSNKADSDGDKAVGGTGSN